LKRSLWIANFIPDTFSQYFHPGIVLWLISCIVAFFLIPPSFFALNLTNLGNENGDLQPNFNEHINHRTVHWSAFEKAGGC